jgi:hypothetical protein
MGQISCVMPQHFRHFINALAPTDQPADPDQIKDPDEPALEVIVF